MLVLLLLPLQVLAQEDYVNPVFQCTEEELKEERETCFGELGQIIPDKPFCSAFPEGDCCSPEYQEPGARSCWGELIPAAAEIVDPPSPSPSPSPSATSPTTSRTSGTSSSSSSTTTLGDGVCPAEMGEAPCGKAIEINTTCTTCGEPKPLEDISIIAPKALCDGEGSFNTVYNQRCATIKATNKSSCMMGSEGYSWCSTEHLWWRDDHWFDWDLCSLCSAGSEKKVLTSSGFECAGPCHNRHNNHESLAPRCKIKNPETDPDGIGMDYCTNCEGAGCPDSNSAPRDERPGNQVGQIAWNPKEPKDDETNDGTEERAGNEMGYDGGDDYNSDDYMYLMEN